MQVMEEVVSPVAKKVEKPFIDQVTELLVEAKHPNPAFWLEGLHPQALQSTDFNLQRHRVNQQWDLIFGAVSSEKVAPEYTCDNMAARYCLLPQGSRQAWLDSFKNGVLPYLMKYQIPLAG